MNRVDNTKTKLFSPAKINLGLKIPYKRSTDHFHQIESLFIPLDFGDDIYLEPTSFPVDFSSFAQSTKESKETYNLPLNMKTNLQVRGDSRKEILEVTESGDPKKNLIYKAWVKILESTNGTREKSNFHISHSPWNTSWNLEITKRIPAGGGLGGGSSNAGTILKWALANHWLEKDDAFAIAKSLGADVPFFLGDSACWVTGIGDILEEISIPRAWGILFVPGIHMDTKSMYRDLKKSLQKPLPSKTWKEQEREILLAIESADWKSLNGRLANDFEEIAFQNHPELHQVCQRFLEWGADYSGMSGSGSTLFALFSSQEERDKCYQMILDRRAEGEWIPFSFK